jgi:MFS family permease
MGLMLLLAGNIRAVFAWAVVPAALCVAVLIFGVKEPKRTGAPAARAPIRWREVRDMGAPFWTVTGFGVVFTLSRFSEAFLVLRASSVGLSAAWVPAVMVVMNLVYAATATPAGALSDRMDRRLVLAVGLAVLIIADLVLAVFGTIAGVMAGVALWGLYMGFSQGLLAALVADSAPERLRGTAFGLFNLASGVALLAASVLAGELWSAYGPRATFLAGAGFAALALAGLLLLIRRR